MKLQNAPGYLRSSAFRLQPPRPSGICTLKNTLLFPPVNNRPNRLGEARTSPETGTTRSPASVRWNLFCPASPATATAGRRQAATGLPCWGLPAGEALLESQAEALAEKA